MNKTVLIIDDELDLRELLKLTLEKMSISAIAVETVSEAKAELKKQSFDLCLTDMRLPDGSGLDVVAYVQKNHPQLPIAVLTAYGNVELAVEALKLGAFDFLSKPVKLSRLRSLISNALSMPDATHIENMTNESLLLGESQHMQNIRQQITKVARSQAPMYISGESGTGKELAARSIHKQSPRAKNLFAPVNCGAIPSNLMESEFFGHLKGSFTGAIEDKMGLFQAASGGTLFLDEVADLPLDMQVKLLRAIQEKRVRPVGSESEVEVDVRLISATHKNLQDAVMEGTFRSDLFYRLNVIDLHMPSLRQRPEDIEPLTEEFLKHLRSNGEAVELSNAALDALRCYNFPGNVRELENILERAATLCENNRIEVTDLKLNGDSGSEEQSKVDRPQRRQPTEINSLDDHLEEIEKEILLDTLERSRWNKTAAAKKLGISFRSIRYRLQKLGLDD
jgi:two-component system response regulator PilR (NtrC family)